MSLNGLYKILSHVVTFQVGYDITKIKQLIFLEFC